jgi:hypothetical protein
MSDEATKTEPAVAEKLVEDPEEEEDLKTTSGNRTHGS